MMILANTSATRTRRSSICLPVRIFPQKRTAFTLTPDRQLLMQARHRVVTVTRDERRLNMDFDSIMREITSGLTGEPEHDIPYLQEQCQKYKDHETVMNHYAPKS